MVKPEEICKGVWTFPIVLPDNPLKWLNCYVIKGSPENRNLLIDTGFNREECYSVLCEGMDALGLTPENTDVFVTHLHSDHSGNAHKLADKGYKIIMGKFEYEFMHSKDRLRHRFDAMTKLQGMSEAEVARVQQENPGIRYAPGKFEATYVEDGDMLCYGNMNLRCCLMPGHTPGHMCLYDAETETMFLGDHVLFDITPNICAWPGIVDSLGQYLKSLDRIAAYKIKVALPAHRNTSDKTVVQRIEELKQHHDRRLNEMLRLLEVHGSLNTNELAAKMTWKIRARNWDEFPLGQKFFAFHETSAHAEYLMGKGLVERIESNGIECYRLTKSN